MQSAFIIRNMDSTPEPQSPKMAATAKRRYRNCTNCKSRMPSITYDSHTLCTKCRKQVCDITLACEECRDWSLSRRQVFVDYNNSLRLKRESKQRQLRLASAYASDQSVYDTDTDVPINEPSVPVQNVHADRLNLGQQKCLVSDELVVSAGTSVETNTSNFLSLTTGEGIDKVVLSLLARITDLEATRGLQPPVQNQQTTNENTQQAVISPDVCQPAVQIQSSNNNHNQQGVILPNAYQPSVESQSIGSAINQHSFILPNIGQPSAQTGSQISQQGLILPNVGQPIFANTDTAGVSAPPPLFLNPVQPIFRLPTTQASDESLKMNSAVSDDPSQKNSADEDSIAALQDAIASTQRAIASARDKHVRQALLDSAESLAKHLSDARLSSRSGDSSSAKPKPMQMATNRQETIRRTATTQDSHSRPEFDFAVPGPSKQRSDESPNRHSDYSSRRESRSPPRKRSRHSGNSSEEDDSYQNRQQRDEQQDEEDNFRPASLDTLLKYITSKFPTASQPLIQPSSKRFHVMECAGVVDESSQQSSNLAWFSHMRSACDTTQRKFESRVSEGKLLSAILPSVSRIEKVSDSPCQGRAVKVNSQVFDLMPSRPAESRSVPLSVKEATSLETTLRGVMESYNFQLWTITALFRFLCDSNCCPADDPLLDQFQRSFSRGAENIAAALTSSTAFVTAKRREAFLSHMFPSVTDAQKRKLLSDPIFDQKDLFAPASIEAAREAARDFSLYRGAQSRPSTSSGPNNRRQFNQPNHRGRHNSSPRSNQQRSQASHQPSGRFQQKRKHSEPPRKRGGFRK